MTLGPRKGKLIFLLSLFTMAAAMPTSQYTDNSNTLNSTNGGNTTTDYTTILRQLFNNTGLSSENNLQHLIQSYLNGNITLHNVSSSGDLPPRMRVAVGLAPALLDYENETEVDELEKVIENSTEPVSELLLPADVYEVPLQVWVEREDESETDEEAELEQPVDDVQMLITEALKPAENTQQTSTTPPHLIRHHSRRSLARGPGRRNRGGGRLLQPENQSMSLPIQSAEVDEDSILNLLRQEPREENESEDGNRPMEIIRTRDRFNMTVDFQAPFHNIESDKLLEIVLLMNSDCTQLPQRMVRWVSGSRGILFECQNGVWVVTYLARQKRKVRPLTVTDCHELHLDGVDLVNPEVHHRLELTYNDGGKKSREVICKHDDRHTNHQLIDNHINSDPEQPVRTIPQTMSGAWTVFQRRVNGDVKFYRSLKRYKTGFGSIESGEYWLGLKILHDMTHTRQYMLRVEVTTSDNRTYYSEYSSFRVGSEAKNFRLRLGDFIEPQNGTLSAGDFLTLHHGGKFHTRDSRLQTGVNCAKLYGTAFWFRGCWTALNLNGPYITDDTSNIGVRWATASPEEERRVWKTEMMIKPVL